MLRWSQKSIARRAGRALLGAGCVGGAGCIFLYSTDPSFERSVRFWRHTGPIVAHYFLERWCSTDEADRDARFQRLHSLYAAKAREVVEELRGMFVKVAQVLSVRPEAVPEQYRNEFRKLQDCAPAARWDPIRHVLERDLGAPVAEVFDQIDQEPLGAASIGQAHRVVWQGRPAVVKVQYPDAAAMLRADFRCLELLLWLVSQDALTILQQVRQQFATELDYESEASHLRELHDAFQVAPDFKGRVVLPEPIPELTSGHVIGMGFLDGPKLEVALRSRLEALGVDLGKQGIGEWLAAQQRNGINKNFSTVQDAESSGSEESSTSFPWNRLTVVLRWVSLDAMLWLARKLANLRSGTGPTADLHSALRLVLDAHGYQLFFCPIFNADPHPGNILMMPDGRIGLIDFGQCRRLTSEQKAGLARLLQAVSQPVSPEADRQVAAAFEATGVKTKHGDPEFLALLPRLMFSRIHTEWVRGDIKETLQRDRIVEVPVHMVMAYRTAMLLRGLCLVLQENTSVAEAWSPWAERWLQASS
ncbi:unnamed protein product [Durusdinium trenchii]|uniref:Uncharacterized protein n=2 Tax=Durusdinium trenchii TaxID=1381693 RepID=A0ABP0P2K8_9DINO